MIRKIQQMTVPMEPPFNVASLVLGHGRSKPERTALVIPSMTSNGTSYTEAHWCFRQLCHRIGLARAGLRSEGFSRGDRVVLMAPLSLDLCALLLALIAEGMTPVIIDAGMKPCRLVKTLTDARATGIVSVHAFLEHWFYVPVMWHLRKYSADAPGPGVRPMEALFADDPVTDGVMPTAADEHALITFTSGSTGWPKGAVRTQGLLLSQHRTLADQFPNDDDEVDCPCFPMVALHNLCSGVPTILPAVDLGRPVSVEPRWVLEQIGRWGITRLSGAPAYLERIVAHLQSENRTENRVRRIAVGGAPVSPVLCRRILDRFPTAEAMVVYGSTEAEPIATVPIADVVAEADRADALGYLVGTVVNVAEVALLDLPETSPILDERGLAPYRVAEGCPGELVVRGPHVNRSYVNGSVADRANKLHEPNGTIWHRTGDVATRDPHGRLWLCGRARDGVRIGGRMLHPLPIEVQLDRVDGVRRTALVGQGERACLWVELEGSTPARVVTDRVRALAGIFGLGAIPVRTVASIPVDDRHNSKIDRSVLRQAMVV